MPDDIPLHTDPPRPVTPPGQIPPPPPGLGPQELAWYQLLSFALGHSDKRLYELTLSAAHHHDVRSQQTKELIEEIKEITRRGVESDKEALARHAELLQWLSDAGVRPSPKWERSDGPGLIERLWRKLPPAAQSGVVMSLGGAVGTLMLMLAGAAVEAITGRQVPMPTVPTISVPATPESTP